MNYKPLKDLCDIQKGQAITGSKVVEGKVPVVAGGKTAPYYHNVANRDADIITISASGAYAGYVNFWSVPIFASDCTTIKPSVELLTTEYLYAFLKSKQEYIYSLQKGAGQPHIYGKDIENIEIPLPPIDTQRKIAAVLDKAQELIDLRKTQIKKLDELLRSVFLDMFGDPVSQEKWESVYLEELFSIIADCPHSTPDYLDKGIPCIRTSDLQGGFLDFVSTKYVSEEEYLVRIKRYIPQAGDIIYSREGERYGIAAIIPLGKKVCLGQRVMIFSANKVKVNEYFAWGLLNSDFTYKQARALIGGSTSPHINIKDIKKFWAYIPPLPLQQRFAAIVEKTEQQKTLIQQSLTEMENNFSSLMQRAFRGELF